MLRKDSLGSRGAAIAALLATSLLTGCGQTKAPPQVSTTWATARQGVYAGSPLEGPQAVPANIGASGAIAVQIKLLALSGETGDVMEPLAALARVITSSQGENPFLGAPTLTQPARYGSGAEAEGLESAINSEQWGPSAPLAAFDAVVPAGATGWLQVTRGERADRDRLRVGVYRPKGGGDVHLAIVVEHPQPTTKPAEGGKSAPTTWRPIRETALVQQSLSDDGQTMAVVVPLQIAEANTRALVALVRISKPGDDATLLSKSVDMMRAAADAAAREKPAPGPDSLDPALVATVVEAITIGEQRRPALVYFAGQTASGLGEQFAVAADEAVLDEVALQLADALQKQPGLWKRADAGWLLDRLAFQRMAQGQVKRQLSPELRGVLVACAGEAGRSPAALEQILEALSTKRDFENRLLAENLISLEDNSPAARVRAYDWLRTRGKAPEAYDPLGDPKQRRAAMERALEALSKAPASTKSEVKP